MDAFKTHEKVINDYRSYLTSFLSIQDEKIKETVENALNDDGFLPEPLIQFNPSFEKGKTLQSLVGQGRAHEDLPSVFGDYSLYKHQMMALEQGIEGKGFVVTSGTGSGKSLTYMATIFNDILKQGANKKRGIKAILVYPMNALINSQEEEIKKYHINYLESKLSYGVKFNSQGKSLDAQIEELEHLSSEKFPITYATYTGQHRGDSRKKVENEKPDIILTNYMMLELIMTRQSEVWMRDSIKDHLSYLIFDELHTYRGRQGSDVAILVRRIKGLCEKNIVSIGTSATMMSGGTPLQRKEAVAEVGKTIFGEVYPTEAIIGEFLVYCTKGVNPTIDELKSSIATEIDLNGDAKSFVNHPLTNWLETNVALRLYDGVLERGKPMSISGISKSLKDVVGGDAEELKAVLIQVLKWTEKLNEKNRKDGTGKSFLPFRFHQFISQTSVVSVTLEPRKDRGVTIKPGRYLITDAGEKLLYPVLFSRISGYDFICVEKDVDENQLKPRNPDDNVHGLTQREANRLNLNEGHFKYGYIVIDEGEEFWDDNPQDFVPGAWMNGTGTALRDFYQWQMPQRIYFDENGNYSSENIYPLKGYFISAKLRVDPTAGVVYEDVKTGENTKLMRIGNEGRSTATTILSFSVVDSLFEQGELYQDQKLLSFTDNRQDASLQSGHFNDFLSILKLRSGVYHALKDSEHLDVHNIQERVFETLNLDETKYAKFPSEDSAFPDVDNERAIKNYLLLRIFQDLKRGWRYTLPNLEQTALLRIEYRNLKRLAGMDDRFEHIEVLKNMSPEVREDTLIQILNYFRTNFSIDHRILLQDRGETESLLKNKLDDKKLWSLDQNERIDTPKYMVTSSPGRTQRGLYTGSVGPRSGLGKFIKRKYQEVELIPPDQEGLREVLDDICLLLSKTNFLSRKEGIKGDRNREVGVTGYLLRTDCILWFKGDGENVGVDQTRINNFKEIQIKPNPFFKRLYKKDFTKYVKEFEGREHTGQLGSGDRIEREERFREGNISALFCSPTMELGIDIANLNIVHMRNVPPNPANYAQRSGRAGRSGQTAVVFTFCSAYSPHDQNYFHASDTMVSGAVVPPRIDLFNQELILTHYHAYLLMEMQLSTLNSSVSSLLDLDLGNNLKLKQSVLDHIDNNLELHGNKWSSNFQEYILGLLPELEKTWWFGENWFNQQTNSFSEKFNEAIERWRILYRAAKKMINASHIVLNDPTIKDKDIKRDAKRQYAIGLKQIELLTNESKSSFGGQSEFYVFRYLASEGFIPGYNFTRLPVRAFVGYKHEDKGEYISRPRSISLREFGPNNIIYHNGNKHRITRMLMTDAEALQRKIKISNDTGYAFLDDQAQKANNDPITHTELKGDNAEYRTNLIEVGESEAVPQMRISCEEEERMSTGFEIDHYFNYPSGIEHTVKAVVQNGGQSLLNLIYGPATNLIHLNRKWNRSADDCFSIDQRTGKWLRQKDLEDDTIRENEKRVMIFAKETADTLYIQPLSNLELSPDETITLSYALKRAVEVLFQVEESEIGISIIGKKDSPNVMIYESSQGSLGILSQLASNPLKLQELFKVAYKCMHFDPETKEETELGKTLPKASYQDLLSYYNQRHHEILDRYAIKETLEYLMDCTVSQTKEGKDREEQYKHLLDNYDKSSSTELKLLKYLYNNCLALPDKAQINVKEFYISADFIYETQSGPVIIFCDGSVHDEKMVKEDDTHKREHLYAKGYDVIEWHYMEPLEDLVKRRKDIFRKVC